MWRHYLQSAAYAIRSRPGEAVIKLIGLAIGFAACLTVLVYVDYERNWDRWVPDSENIYQLQSRVAEGEGGEPSELQMSSYVAGKALKKDFPQVRAAVFALPSSASVLRGGEALPAEDLLYVDGPFFDVLPLPLAKGDPRTALTRPGTLVVTQTEARRLFGAADPVGRIVTLSEGGRQTDHRVTGILRDLPKNSHLKIGMLARFDPASHYADRPQFMTEWGWIAGWNYVALRAGADPSEIETALPAWERRNIPDQDVAGRKRNEGKTSDWLLTNIRDVHLGSAQTAAMRPGNDRRTIATFTVVALLILAMACFNYGNLATARASQRGREVALRKVLGAHRRQLFVQFTVESLLVASFAMLLALALVELLLPALAGFLDSDLHLRYLGSGGMLLVILGLVALAGAAGGIYPAIHVSRLQPGQVLKANKSAAEAPSAGWLRSALVVGQFAVSIGLIVCTFIVYTQVMHARTSDPGFAREGLLQIDISDPAAAARGEALALELGRMDGIVAASRTEIGIATGRQVNTEVMLPGNDKPVPISSYAADENFLRTMGMTVLAGRSLSLNRQLDKDPRGEKATSEENRALAARGLNVLVNALAARRLGFADPARAVGAQMRLGDAGIPLTIVGVVRDARLRTVYEPIEPMMLRLGDSGFTTLVARYRGDPGSLRQRIEQTWRRLLPKIPPTVEFADEILADIYRPEEARAQVFGGFAALAIVIAALGLFGLAAFTAERRTKEIGIRKVLGARSRDIVALLAWQFSKPVIIANLVAWPFAWWAMRDWLNSFDSRVPLGPVPFLVAGFLALAIALATIASHALRVARANPIHALRSE